MMQLLLSEPVVLCWGIGVVISLIYWLLFSPGSKLAGMGLQFFDTAPRSIILSEAIGLGGSIINVIFVPESTWTVIFLALWSTPLIIVTAYLSQILRHSIESHQSSASPENNPKVKS